MFGCHLSCYKMSSRNLQDFLQRYLQDVFKVYHQVNLFYLTRPREVFNTFLSTEEFAQVTLFLRNLWSVYKICERDIKLSSFSFSLYYTFSWLLTEAYLEPGRTSTMAFFCGKTSVSVSLFSIKLNSVHVQLH